MGLLNLKFESFHRFFKKRRVGISVFEPVILANYGQFLAMKPPISFDRVSRFPKPKTFLKPGVVPTKLAKNAKWFKKTSKIQKYPIKSRI